VDEVEKTPELAVPAVQGKKLPSDKAKAAFAKLLNHLRPSKLDYLKAFGTETNSIPCSFFPLQ
jgi:hypothetical protein